MYSFFSQMYEDDDQWIESKKRFNTLQDCVDAVSQWLKVSAESGIFPSVKIVEMVDTGLRPK